MIEPWNALFGGLFGIVAIVSLVCAVALIAQGIKEMTKQ